MFGWLYWKKTSLMTYCYSIKMNSNMIRKISDIIYSIKDKGMISNMSDYTEKNTLAVKYYNRWKTSI